jgi:hypothetical protein
MATVGNVKGLAMLDMVKWLRRNREEALAALPQSVAHYLDLRISAPAWYPETDYVQLLHTYIKLAKLERSWYRVGEQSARTSVRTVHRNVLREGDVEGTIGMMPVAWRNYHDTGTITVEVVGQGHATLVIKGYVTRDADICTMIRGYYVELIRLAGAAAASSESIKCTGLGHTQCEWEFRWKL